MPKAQGALIIKTPRAPRLGAAKAEGALIVKPPPTPPPSAAQHEQRGGKLVLLSLTPGLKILPQWRALPNSCRSRPRRQPRWLAPRQLLQAGSPAKPVRDFYVMLISFGVGRQRLSFPVVRL